MAPVFEPDPDCLFCKIASGEIPSEKVYDDGEFFVIKDINPLAPVHLLIISYVHVPTLLDLPEVNANLVGKAFNIAKKMANDMGIAKQGFRIMHNVNKWGGQVIFHMHFHVLGGTKLD